MSSNNLTVLNSIMSRNNNTAVLIPGDDNGQAYRTHQSLNGKGIVGRGVYCTPHIQISFGYSGAIQVNGV